MVLRKRINKMHLLIGTSFGIGFSPIAPGTIGSLVGCTIGILLMRFTELHDLLLAILILIFFFLGIKSSRYLEHAWGKDPSKVVIDEIVGMWIAMFLIPTGWTYTTAAFMLFRIFDIYKPLFIRRMENLNGGLGIMMDDVLAGVYANVIIQCFYLLKIFING